MAKKLTHRDMPRRQRNAVRSVSREILFELEPADGKPFDLDRARALLEERIPRVVGSIWVTIAIQLGLALLRYWLENRVKEPAAIFELGEPGSDDDVG